MGVTLFIIAIESGLPQRATSILSVIGRLWLGILAAFEQAAAESRGAARILVRVLQIGFYVITLVGLFYCLFLPARIFVFLDSMIHQNLKP